MKSTTMGWKVPGCEQTEHDGQDLRDRDQCYRQDSLIGGPNIKVSSFHPSISCVWLAHRVQAFPPFMT